MRSLSFKFMSNNGNCKLQLKAVACVKSDNEECGLNFDMYVVSTKWGVEMELCNLYCWLSTGMYNDLAAVWFIL